MRSPAWEYQAPLFSIRLASAARSRTSPAREMPCPYPVDFHPSQLVEGAFGMITGDPTHVRIFFDRKVSRYVRRRRWHPSQKIRNVPNGIELVMNVQGTAEMPSWIMSFGEHAEILEPPKLRDEVADKLEQAAARYRRRR